MKRKWATVKIRFESRLSANSPGRYSILITSWIVASANDWTLTTRLPIPDEVVRSWTGYDAVSSTPWSLKDAELSLKSVFRAGTEWQEHKKNKDINAVPLQNSPEFFSRNPILRFFQVGKRFPWVFGMLPRLHENMLESEHLVCSATAKMKDELVYLSG